MALLKSPLADLMLFAMERGTKRKNPRICRLQSHPATCPYADMSSF